VARSITKAVRPALAAALLLVLARPVSAGCPPCGCMSWCSSPRPSLPTGPCFGYNKTVWHTWPEACAAAQPVILAHPVALDAPAANVPTGPEEWAHTRPNVSGRLLELRPMETKQTSSQSAGVGESPYHAVQAASAPAP
jgi:hypothetical protein